MQVQVLRVSGMPFNTQVWVDDRPHRCTVYVDSALVTESGVRFLEAILDYNARYWQRRVGKPTRSLHPVAG